MDFRIENDFPPHPQCYRGVCEACGVGTRPGVPVVSIPSISIDHEDGRYTGLFLCGSCVTEWAQAIGMLTTAQAALLTEEVRQLRVALSQQDEELQALENVRAAIALVRDVVDA